MRTTLIALLLLSTLPAAQAAHPEDNAREACLVMADFAKKIATYRDMGYHQSQVQQVVDSNTSGEIGESLSKVVPEVYGSKLESEVIQPAYYVACMRKLERQKAPVKPTNF